MRPVSPDPDDGLPLSDPTVSRDGTPIYSLADREAVRMPLWLSIIGGAAITFAVQMLGGVEWKPALAALLAGTGPLLFGTEIARQKAWSPSSVLTAATLARQDAHAQGVRAQRRAQRAAPTPLP